MKIVEIILIELLFKIKIFLLILNLFLIKM